MADQEAYAPGSALTRLFGDTARTRIIAALVSESDIDLNVTDIAEIAGIHRTTVYEHIHELEELGIIRQTRMVGGSPMYQLDRDDAIAERVAKLEWELMDRL